MYDCFRPGDVVRAKVLSLGDARSYYLTTADNSLGVVHAKSLAGAWCEGSSTAGDLCLLSGAIDGLSSISHAVTHHSIAVLSCCNITHRACLAAVTHVGADGTIWTPAACCGSLLSIRCVCYPMAVLLCRCRRPHGCCELAGDAMPPDQSHRAEEGGKGQVT